MSKEISKEKRHILPEMAVLDLVSRFKGSEAVFKKYEEQAGVCLCCSAPVETLRDVAEKYGINLQKLLTELEVTTEE